MATIYIGLSGYSYKPWQGPTRFYPPTLKQADFLDYYSTRYRTVELDGVWFRLPTLSAATKWIAHTPDHFVFSVKAHRTVTHVKRLSPEATQFLLTMLEHLAPLADKRKLGPILLQLPPNFKRNDDRLAEFLQGLPSAYRWVMEFRHDSWNHSTVERLLRQFRVAWATVEMDERPPVSRDTADFIYARLRRSQYSINDLRRWGEYFVEARKNGRDCYVYCKHEDEGSPWIWADQLLKITDIAPLPDRNHR
ncbi:MAG: DUF72 domain-containing protein [Nitrospira sp.]|nr:DUF72 domain-containing protein [Nitrospira sp.]